MATPLTIIDVGHAAGVILPQQVLDRLHLGLGDTLVLIETAQGFELLPEDTELARQMAIAEQIMIEDHDLLRKLAD